MSYPIKLQCIKRKSGWRQYYLNIPSALAEAIDCHEGESWAFTLVDRKRILLVRSSNPRIPPLLQSRKPKPGKSLKAGASRRRQSK
jgi:hypothetical protein